MATPHTTVSRTITLTLAFVALTSASLPLFAGPTRKAKVTPAKAKVAVAVAPIRALSLQPATAALDGSYSFQTLAAVGSASDGSTRDLSETAVFTSSNPSVVRIGKDGIAYPVKDGTAEITVSAGGQSAKGKFTVVNTKTDANLSFENAITPILVKNGCSGSACHGAPNGQGGLKLSFFGYEPQKDWDAIVKGGNGRRIKIASPLESLFFRKPTNLAGHAGGKRFLQDGPEARVFAAWLKAGTPFKPKALTASTASGPKLVGFTPDPKANANAPRILSITVLPDRRLIRQPDSRHQLIVMAKYSDGEERDVTPFARYACDDDGIAIVAGSGKLTALRKGEANIMVRYAGKVGLSSVMVQPQPPSASYPDRKPANYIDEAVFAKLKVLNILPSEKCDDAMFIRRVYMDIAGTPPQPPMVRDFVDDTDKNKRAKLIDELLERPEFKDYQTILWADLLRVNRQVLQEDGAKAYIHFIRESFAENKPFNQFVRELITGQGSTYHNESATANYYRVTSDPSELTTSTSQIFMGVRLECCRCHNHPFDRWSQDDFYGFASFFSKTHLRGGTAKDEIVVFTDGNGEVRQLRTGQVMPPKVLTDEQPLADTSGDVRSKLADWITAPENPFFAKATVNRIWKQFFGRGIVHPVDDFRATNPPINPALLDALAKDFVAHNYDIKYLIRTLCNSEVYQLSSQTNSTNGEDTKNFSHYYIKRLGPEQLLDSISQATGVPEMFPGVAPGTKAINLVDNNIGSFFLDVFGRSRRILSQERNQETSIAQALALMNGGTINSKISSPKGRIAKLIASLGDRSEKAILEEMFLATFARTPTEKELKQALAYLEKAPTHQEGFEDLMWAMLNTREFLFNH